jgi:hypothetical protein
MGGTDMGAVTELHRGHDQVDHDRREQFVDVVNRRVGQVPDEEPEIQRCREQHELPEDHLSRFMSAAAPCPADRSAPDVRPPI